MSINSSVSTRNIVFLHKFASCFGLTPTDGLSTVRTRSKSKLFSLLLLMLLLGGYLYSIIGRYVYNYPVIMPTARFTDFISYTMICLSNVGSILEIGIVKCDKLKRFVTNVERVNRATRRFHSRTKSGASFLLEFVWLHAHAALYVTVGFYYWITYLSYYFKYSILQFFQQYAVLVLVLLIHNCVMCLKQSFANVNADLVDYVRSHVNFNTAQNVKMRRSCKNVSVVCGRDEFSRNGLHVIVRTYLELLDLTDTINDVFGYQMLILMGKIFTDLMVPLNIMTIYVPRNIADHMIVFLNVFCVLWSTLSMVSPISCDFRRLDVEISFNSVEI